jgi:hypothetical protein
MWMTTLQPYRLALGLAIGAAALGACTLGPTQPGMPSVGVAQHSSMQTAGAIRQLPPPIVTQRGIYVDLQTGISSSEIVGYRSKKGRPRPFCRVNGISYADRIAADPFGDLIVPDSFTSSVTVFHGPRMCGRRLGSFEDSYGQPLDAASDDAAKGNIAVANIFDNSGNGSISVCTVARGCTKNLTNSNMVEVAGVAMANNGDCWASAVNSMFVSTLTFFKHCTGTGQLSGGFRNKSYGGLDIDATGDIMSISWSGYSSALYVYQGCNPHCRLIGGPFPLRHQTMTGHLNEDGTTFAAADYQRTRIDVYRYTPTSLSYQYSITDGLSGGTTAGVAFAPRSKE